MTAFLTTLLRLSLLGSLLAAVLFLLKPLLRGRVSRAAAYYLWLLVLLRLCVPVGLTLPLPEVSTPMPVQASTTQQPVASGQTPPATSTSPEATQPNQSDLAPGPTPEPAPKGKPLPALVFALWAAGAVGVGGWYVTGYLRVRRTISQSAVPAGQEAQAILAALEPQGHVQLVESPAVGSPLLLGLFRPVIVLPVGLTDPARLRDILSHELTHARRYDLLVKWFAALAASIHWFNPLLILVRREIGRACELACDEAVVKALDAPARKHYGETLLLLAAEAPMGALPLAVTLCEEKKTLQERLMSIVKVQKPTPAALLLTLVLVLALGGCSLFTGASAAAKTDQFRNPDSGAVLRLGMTKEEAETLLGEGRQVEEFSGYLRPDGERKTILYDNYGAGEDAITLGYLDGRVCVIYANGKFVYQELERSAAPFRWMTARGIGCGSSLEEVQAQYPGEAKASPDVADYLGIEDLTVYTVEKTEDYSMELYLSEGEGVWSISIYSAELMTQEELEAIKPSGFTPLDDWNP